MIDTGSAYAEVQTRMSTAVAGLSPDDLRRPVPACPGWSVHDLVAHHAAVVVELAAGVVELGDVSRLLDQHSDPVVARDRDAMSARQVQERRALPIAAVLQEWAEGTARIVPMLRGETPFPDGVGAVGGVIAVNDVVVHEGDLHEALGVAPPPAVPATSLALAGYGFSLDRRVRLAGLPALAVAYDGKRRVFGEGEPAAVVAADRTTLVRLLASRLTTEQVVALDWDGDPGPYLEVIPEYGPARPA